MIREATNELYWSVVYTLGWPVGRLLHKANVWPRGPHGPHGHLLVGVHGGTGGRVTGSVRG